MFRRGPFIVRILAALVLVAILLAAGAVVYRLGFAQGWAQNAALSSGEMPRFGPGFPYGPGYYRPHFAFFSGFLLLGLCLFGLLFLFLFGALLRGPWFWGRRWGYPGHTHGHPHPAGGPSWAKERPVDEPRGEGPPTAGEPERKEGSG